MKIWTKTTTLLSFVSVLLVASNAYGALIVDEVDNDGTWTLVTAGWSSGANDLEPEAGDQYFFALPGNNQIRGIYKNSWGENYQFGTTLIATFKIGMENRDNRPNLNAMMPYFYVGTDATDSDTWITDTRVVTGNTPALGEWETWTLETTISQGLTTQGGTPITEDDPIGFFFRMRGVTDGQGAFDDLTIIPEPATLSAIMIGALGLALLNRRRRFRQ